MIIFKEMVLLVNMILTIVIVFGSSEKECTEPEPLYLARDKTFYARFIRHLLVTETLEGKDKITMNKADINILTTPTKTNVDQKLTALHKYKTKMQSLLCYNAFIVYYLIRNIDMADPSIVDFGSFYDQMTLPMCHDEYEAVGLHELHDFLNRMVSVFYIGQFFVPKWFWIILIDLKVYFSIDDSNISFAIKSKQMQEIMNYIRKCQTLNYLPSTENDHFEVSIPFDEYKKTANIAATAQSLYDVFDFDRIKQTEQLFKLENFKLSKFLSNHDWIHYYNIDSVNWDPIKEIEKNLFNFNFCREFIESASFLYQKTIVRIITTKLLIFVFKHITIYFRSVEFYRAEANCCSYTDLISDQMRYKLVEFWWLLDEPLNLAVKFLHLYNGPLWNLTQVIMDPIKLINITQLETLFNDLKEELFHQLDMLKSNYSANLMSDTMVINEKTDMKSPTVTQNMKFMKHYVLKAENFLKPLDFYFLQFYTNYNNNIIPMSN